MVTRSDEFTNGQPFQVETRPASIKINVDAGPNDNVNCDVSMAYRLRMTVEETSNADPNIFVYESIPTAAGRDPNQTRFVTVATPSYMQELPLLEPSIESSYMFRQSTVDLFFRTIAEVESARDRIFDRVRKLLEGMESLVTLRRQMNVTYEFNTDEPYSSIVA